MEWGEKHEENNKSNVRGDGNKDEEDSREDRDERSENKENAAEAEESEETAELERCNGIEEVEGRVSHTLVWMEDYVDREGSSEDEAYIAQVTVAEDPFYFEEVMKEEKWIRAMDNEIMSIEKNKTWN